MAEHYQDFHRYLLQWFMARKLVTEQDAKQMFRKTCEIYDIEYNPADFLPSIALINQKLKPLSMEIRNGKAEDSGVIQYALVNCFEDEHSKLATDFSAHEISLFRKVLESIIMSDDGDSSLMDLINLGSDLPSKINPSAAESLLMKFVEENWLTKIGGNISLGPRTIIELGLYLKKIYAEDIPDCQLCMDIVIKGQTCANCGIRLHLYCSNIYFKDRPPNTRKCPGCQANWLHEIPQVSYEQGMETESSLASSQRQKHAGARESGRQPSRS